MPVGDVFVGDAGGDVEHDDAALTWDVPDGPLKPPQQLSIPLNVPKAPPHRDMVPVWVAAGGLAGALMIGGAVFGIATLMKRRRQQQ